MNTSTPRRGFFQRASVLVVGAAVDPLGIGSAAIKPVDEPWLANLNGKHKQIFDTAAMKDGRPFARVMNFMDAYVEAYELKDADINAIVGVHGAGLPLALNDSIWAKYEFGRRYEENDPSSGGPARRNPYATGLPFSVATLRQRGVRFIACQRSIRRLSGELAVGGGSAEPIRQELLANLLPGVHAVPALIVAVNRAQEAGLTYAFLG